MINRERCGRYRSLFNYGIIP